METFVLERKCQKCGSEPEDKYIGPELVAAMGLLHTATGEEIKNSIERTCKNCRYRWHEKPLDS